MIQEDQTSSEKSLVLIIFNNYARKCLLTGLVFIILPKVDNPLSSNLLAELDQTLEGLS